AAEDGADQRRFTGRAVAQVGVPAAGEQDAQDVRVVAEGRGVHRAAAGGRLPVGVGAGVEQDLHRRRLARGHRQLQQAGAVGAGRVGVDAGGQARAQRVGVTAQGGIGERGGLGGVEGVVHGRRPAAGGRACRKEKDQDTGAHAHGWCHSGRGQPRNQLYTAWAPSPIRSRPPSTTLPPKSTTASTALPPPDTRFTAMSLTGPSKRSSMRPASASAPWRTVSPVELNMPSTTSPAMLKPPSMWLPWAKSVST